MTSVNRLEEKPSEELSFFLGAWLGDGWRDGSDGGKRLLLKVRSRQFAEEFARSATAILRTSSPYVARKVEEETGTWYQVKVTSVLLFKFVNRPLSEIVPCVEPRPCGFLRGFFTAEGNQSVSIGSSRGRRALQLTLCVSNTEIEYMRCAMSLVKQLGYHPSKITRGGRPGLERKIGSWSLITETTEWQFRLARLREIESFLAYVGFADPVKQSKTRTALNLVKELGAASAAMEWTRLYDKIGRKWARRTT